MYGFVLNEFKQPKEAEKYTSKVLYSSILIYCNNLIVFLVCLHREPGTDFLGGGGGGGGVPPPQKCFAPPFGTPIGTAPQKFFHPSNYTYFDLIWLFLLLNL